MSGYGTEVNSHAAKLARCANCTHMRDAENACGLCTAARKSPRMKIENGFSKRNFPARK